MPKKKEQNTPVIVYVLWILIAIIGVGLLFTGLQSSIIGNGILVSSMLVIIGIILMFIGLIMILGKANIEAEDLIMPKEEKK